jgi:hypothetical protein
MANGWKAHSFHLHNDGMGAAVVLPDLISHGIDLSPTVEAYTEPGDIYPTLLSGTRVEVSKTIQTALVEDYLDEIGVGGLCIKTATNPGAKIFLSKRDECAGQVAGSVNRSLLVSSGFIFPQTLTCEHGGNAEITFGIALLYDGSNDPIVISDVVALPTITLASRRWTLGKTDIAGVSLADYTRLSIDFGFQVEAKSRQSDVYDTILEVKQSNPTVEITGELPTWFTTANIPLAGKACTHANSIFYLRKRAVDGTAAFVADATAEHLKFTTDGVVYPINPSNSDGDKYAATGLRIICREDASANAPIVYAGATAIT